MANISLDSIDTITAKLDQANAIAILLLCECEYQNSLVAELRINALKAISDFIVDSIELFRSEVK